MQQIPGTVMQLFAVFMALFWDSLKSWHFKQNNLFANIPTKLLSISPHLLPQNAYGQIFLEFFMLWVSSGIAALGSFSLQGAFE